MDAFWDRSLAEIQAFAWDRRQWALTGANDPDYFLWWASYIERDVIPASWWAL